MSGTAARASGHQTVGPAAIMDTHDQAESGTQTHLKEAGLVTVSEAKTALHTSK